MPQENIQTAAERIRSGELVAFPTETVYGLGANALDEKAVQKIYTAKGRPSTNPLIVHVLGAAEAKELVSEWPATAEKLAARFWPGPLTMILKKKPIVPNATTAGSDTVAIRAPAHPVARELLVQSGVPIAAPSANKSGEVSPVRAEHVRASLGDPTLLILDDGPVSGGIESTVIDLTSSPPRILRPGLVSSKEITAIIGPIDRFHDYVDTSSTAPMPSPGMQSRHYAPRIPLILSNTPIDDAKLALATRRKVGLITLEKFGFESPECITRGLGTTPAIAARNLYEILHELDSLNLDLIIAENPPPGDEWIAIHDRLFRASLKEKN